MTLTKEEARAQAEGKPWCFRSCWNCNGAPEHLKEADYVVVCFACGNLYYKGTQLNDSEPQEASLAQR